MKNTEIKTRLRYLLETKGVNPNSISASTGYPQSNLQKQINGDTKVSLETVSVILDLLGDVSAEWLLRGEGEMTKSAGVPINIITDSKVATNGSSIDSHNTGTDLTKENQELRLEVKQLRERCDKLTDRLLDM